MKAIENGMDMNIFDYMRSSDMEKEAPLAARMRPRTLEEVVGQEHIIGRDKLLYRAIKADKISSVIFYGPPGTGKTTLAKVIASTTSAEFTQINATVAGKKDMEEVVAKAKEIQGMYGKRTILFIDEIHRFNKAQQDYLLPFVEDGTVILIGATTENPYFEVNGALLSRSIIFELKPIPVEAVRELLRKAVCDTDRGMGAYGAVIDEDALDFLADISGGDARHALNAIELDAAKTARFTSPWMWRRSAFRNGRPGMISQGTTIMIPFPHLSKACGAPTRMRLCIILPGCFMREKMLPLWPDAS